MGSQSIITAIESVVVNVQETHRVYRSQFTYECTWAYLDNMLYEILF